VGQESPVEVQHAQEAAELTGGLGRRAVLEACYSHLQRLGTLDGHFVPEEGDFVCSEDALRWVDEDPVPLQLFEECPQMLLVLFG
jgi:hypothetical protein